MQNIQLGREYNDRITGFVGIATGHVEYLTGCNQTLLAPKVGEAGDFKESRWFDDQRLAASGSAWAIVLDNGTTPGCDMPAPVR